MPKRLHAFLCGLMFCGLTATGTGADGKPAPAPDFKRDVLPIFEAKCLHCHGAKRRDGKLDMRTLESLLAGGVSGPAIKPGNAPKSLVVELIHYQEMPPKKEPARVTPAELDRLRSWINAMPAPTVTPPRS